MNLIQHGMDGWMDEWMVHKFTIIITMATATKVQS
jgi:hypothetical protein